MSEHEFVPRPTSGPSKRKGYIPTDQLIATVTNGQAVRIPLDGRERPTVVMASMQAARRRGYRSRSRRDGDHIILWWETR